MKTEILQLEADEFKAIVDRHKGHVVAKGDYKVGQRLILQPDTDEDVEVTVTVGHVQTSPGLMKGHVILTIKATPPPADDKDQKIELPHDETNGRPAVLEFLDDQTGSKPAVLEFITD